MRPLPLPPRELAQRLSRSRAALVDSAVTAIVQAYLDSIANDPASKNQGLPSWTTKIAGKKFGLDSKNIYIAVSRGRGADAQAQSSEPAADPSRAQGLL